MKETDEAFGQTTKVLFGKPLKGRLADFEKWLLSDMPPIEWHETEIGPVMRMGFVFFDKLPVEKIANIEFAKENSKKRLNIGKGNFYSLAAEFGEIGRAVCDFQEGENKNVQQSVIYNSCQNCFRVACCFFSKYCAYDLWSSLSEYCFGCYRNMNGVFCINCYYSVELSRCFELDACKKCADCYYCHNCENLSNCMFCFNLRNKQYAIGNVEVGRKKYMMVKEMLAAWVERELEKEGKISLSIFNLPERV